MSLLTDQILTTGVSLTDLIHIVITGDTSQNPAGSSYKATIGQVASLISGGTSGTSGLNGTSGTSGTDGTSGFNGNDGSNSGRWTLDMIGGASPQHFTADYSTISSITQIVINQYDINSADYDAWLLAIDSVVSATNRLYLQVTEVGNNSIIGIWTVDTVTIAIGASNKYYLDVTNVVSNGSLTDGLDYTISWVYNGVNGTSGTSGVSPTLYYGSFYDTGDQTGLASTVLTMSANTSDPWNNGVSVSANTRFVIQNPGVYNLLFSGQLVKTGGNSATNAHIWLSQNGTNVADSAGQIGLPSNSVYMICAWNYFFETTTSNEYVELKWEINSNVDNQLFLKYAAASGNVPAIPSVIITINKIN